MMLSRVRGGLNRPNIGAEAKGLFSMKRIRRIVFWCHLSAGVLAGLVILIMSVTGALLAFQPQIERFADRPIRTVQPPEGDSRRLGAQTLFAKVREVRSNFEPISLTLRRDPSDAASFALGRESVLYVNPYSGEVLGEGSKSVRGFFRFVTDWHRWLGAQGESRVVTRAVTGACNTTFLVLALTGIFLWWPKTLSRQNLRSVMMFKPGLKGRARDFNWHNATGFLCAVILVLLTGTGMVLSYQWANNLLYTLTGSELPAQSRGPADRGATSGLKEVVGLDRLWSRAEEKVSRWESIAQRFPQRPGDPVVFSIREGVSWNPMATSQLTLDPASADVVKWEPYEGLSLGRRLRSWARYTHTGEAGGLPGQFIAFMASLGGGLLVWTGLSLALRRFRGLRAQVRSAEAIPSSRPREQAANAN
jgi:uncharacterized iron-regulated membrane protein